jgi:hypothetical protein
VRRAAMPPLCTLFAHARTHARTRRPHLHVRRGKRADLRGDLRAEPADLGRHVA